MKNIKSITPQQIAKNLRTWFLTCPDEVAELGLVWYLEGNNWLKHYAKIWDMPVHVLAGITSALSPNAKWYQNTMSVERIVNCYLDGKSIDDCKVTTYNPNKRKAWAILEAWNQSCLDCDEMTPDDVIEFFGITAPKTRAFYSNLMMCNFSVTVDKWHIRACLSTPNQVNRNGVNGLAQNCTAKEYAMISDLTVDIAKDYGLRGCELQAIIWLNVRLANGYQVDIADVA